MPDLYFGFETATSLFLCASLNAPLSFCKELLDSGADVNALGVVKRGKLRNNHTAFCAAVYANRFDLVDLMLCTGKCNLEAVVLKAGVKWSLQSLVGGRIDRVHLATLHESALCNQRKAQKIPCSILAVDWSAILRLAEAIDRSTQVDDIVHQPCLRRVSS
jgi:hypothetical protein